MAEGSDRDGPGAALMLVLSTAPDAETAERLVEQLVKERLIACGNVVPGLTSIYRWQGEVAREGEVLLLMKTARARVQRLFARLPELHPYEVPELIALPVDEVTHAYRQWVSQETTEVSA